MWGIPAFIFLIAFFHRVRPGVITKELMQAFHVSSTIVGLLSSTYFYAYAGFMIPAGLLIDAFGARWTIAIGGAIMGLGTLAMAVAENTGPLFAGRFAVGLGATVTFIGTLKIAATWFPPSHFGTLAAISATVGVLGSIVGTFPLAALVALTGWRTAFWLIGLVTIVLSLACAVIVRDRPEGSHETMVPLPTLLRVRHLAGPARVRSAHRVLVRPNRQTPKAALPRADRLLRRAVDCFRRDPRFASALWRLRALLRDWPRRRRLRADVAARTRGQSTAPSRDRGRGGEPGRIPRRSP